MRTLVLQGNVKEIEKAYYSLEALVDAFELRLDLMEDFSYTCLQRFREKVKKPLIFTIKGRILEKKNLLLSCLKLFPTYCDLPKEFPFFDFLKESFPGIKWILSYHNFRKIPENLEEIVQEMEKKKADVLKIACPIKRAIEAFSLFSLTRKISGKKVVLAIGRKGRWTRCLSPFMENQFHYLAKDKKSAFLGQYTVKEWQKFSFVNKHTKFYALLGNPISSSKGDLFHNHAFLEKKRNSLYLKIPCNKGELVPFVKQAKKYSFEGFSVTMPLKEEALFFEGEKFPSINTLVRQKNTFLGYNTDVKAALALFKEANMPDATKILLVGTGAVARAIGEAFFRRKKIVHFLGRNKLVLEKLREQGFLTSLFSELELEKWEQELFLIQATPIKKRLLFPENFLQPTWTILDLIYVPEKTALCKAAEKKGCKIISGKKFFLLQAKKQQELWERIKKPQESKVS